MKTIYASLTGRSGDRPVMETALLLNRLLGATADFHHVRLDPATITRLGRTTPFSASYLINEQLIEMANDARERAERAQLACENFIRTHGKEIVSTGSAQPTFTWTELTGIDTDETIAKSRVYDLLVLGRDAEMHYRGRDRLGAVVMDCGRPVLIVPEKAPPASLCDTIVVAWKDRAEAARALTAAAPLLAKAKRIIAVHISEGTPAAGKKASAVEQLGAQLRKNGYPVEVREANFDAGTVAGQLRAVVAETNADLLVSGAYGHSRLRELILGGVTEELIDNCAVPVLLFH